MCVCVHMHVRERKGGGMVGRERQSLIDLSKKFWIIIYWSCLK